MLQKIAVKKLLNQFDYELILSNDENDRIRFISGPNGYGKTCILRIINCLYCANYDALLDIPFSSVEMIVDDAKIAIEKVVKEQEQDDGSDRINEAEIKSLIFTYKTADIEHSIEVKVDDDFSELDVPFALHLNSLRCYFIPDRVVPVNEDDLRASEQTSEVATTIEMCASGLKEQLENNKYHINRFEERLSLFKSIISELQFTNKKMILGGDFGFLFQLNDERNTIIQNSRLSSGEQHIIIQLYNMLFCKAGDYLLTLIDEPELSLHPAWIAVYYRHLAQIVELRNMQCILATHSADIFNMQWDKCIDLYELLEA